jgi:hypothetical protein
MSRSLRAAEANEGVTDGWLASRQTLSATEAVKADKSDINYTR